MAYRDTGTMPDGIAAAPGLAFDAEPQTGFYRPAAGQLGVAIGGVGVATFDAGGLQGGGGPSLFFGPLDLDDDEIKGLPTADGFDLVAAPGAGKRIRVQSVDLESLIVAPYTNQDAAFLEVRHPGANAGLDFLINEAGADPPISTLSDFLGVGSRIATLLPYRTNTAEGVLASPSVWAGSENQPLQLRINNGEDGDLTGGDPGNKMRISGTYRVEDVLS